MALGDRCEDDEAILCEKVTKHKHALLDLFVKESEARPAESEGEREQNPASNKRDGKHRGHPPAALALLERDAVGGDEVVECAQAAA